MGLQALTIEAIAARAGVGKQTIYRWWASKTDVLLDAFVDDALSGIDPQDSGNLEKDLRRHLTNLSKFLTQSDAGAVFKALIGQAQNDPQLAEKIRVRFTASQRQADCLPIVKAIERGDLPRKTDVDAIVDSLVGPIYYRVLVSGAPLTPAFIKSIVEHFLASIKT